MYRITLFLIWFLLLTNSAFSQTADNLKIDPMLLVSLKECRNISKALGGELFSGWQFEKTPVLLYRPKVQDVLINFPHKPEGFVEYTGFNPLGTSPIYVRNEKTFIEDDDQNTTREIEGVKVLVVADQFSRMRNQLRFSVLEVPKEQAEKWLDEWNFVQSVYGELTIILHESFHVHQETLAPKKRADEGVVARYPVLDPVNNSLYILEGDILRDALLATNAKTRLEKIKQFVAVRQSRQSRLDKNLVEYENLNEYSEGLAKYVEYKFLRAGQKIIPVKEMFYRSGFEGYGAVLEKQFQNRVKQMVEIVAVRDDRTGNRYGAGPLRFKLYELGAMQALLLDTVMPNWKEKIFTDGVYLTDLLKQAMALSSPQEANLYLEKAKAEYKYEDAYQEKLKFETEGKRKIQEKLDAILKTKQTLVKISYESFTDEIRIGYTPFGVTMITPQSAIYDLVPIAVGFKKGVVLRMKQTIPVLIDKEKKQIIFAVSTPPDKFLIENETKVETDEFLLSTVKTETQKTQNTIEFKLK